MTRNNCLNAGGEWITLDRNHMPGCEFDLGGSRDTGGETLCEPGCKAKDGIKHLFVPLATKPFRAFQSGAKTAEVRQDAPRWASKHVYAGRRVILRRGYSTKEQLLGHIICVERAPRLQDLPAGMLEDACINMGEVGRYFDPEKPVVAFRMILPSGKKDKEAT
jgi:hypothetical protein